MDKLRKWPDTHTSPDVKWTAGRKQLNRQGASPVLCDEREGRGGEWGGQEAWEGQDSVYLWPVQQKPTQHCKATILQLTGKEILKKQSDAKIVTACL